MIHQVCDEGYVRSLSMITMSSRTTCSGHVCLAPDSVAQETHCAPYSVESQGWPFGKKWQLGTCHYGIAQAINSQNRTDSICSIGSSCSISSFAKLTLGLWTCFGDFCLLPLLQQKIYLPSEDCSWRQCGGCRRICRRSSQSFPSAACPDDFLTHLSWHMLSLWNPLWEFPWFYWRLQMLWMEQDNVWREEECSKCRMSRRSVVTLLPMSHWGAAPTKHCGGRSYVSLCIYYLNDW